VEADALFQEAGVNLKMALVVLTLLVVLVLTPWAAAAPVEVQVRVAPTIVVTGGEVHSNFPARVTSENGLLTVAPL
jgi:hypothetical protein